MPLLLAEGLANPAAAGNLLFESKNGGNALFDLGDDLGVNEFQVRNASSAPMLRVTSLGSVIIEGDLQVKGASTTFEVGTQVVEDNMIGLNYVASGGAPPAVSAGLFVQRADLAGEAEPTAGTPSATHRQLIWNETDDVWAMQVDATTIVPILYSTGTPATAYAGTSPNLATRGDAVGTSGAAQIGLYDDATFVTVTAPGTVQEAVRQLDAGMVVATNLVDGPNTKSGSTAIASGGTTVAITFTTPFATGCTHVICSFKNTVDASPLMCVATVTAAATTGFTATLSGATDSANYLLDWIAMGS